MVKWLILKETSKVRADWGKNNSVYFCLINDFSCDQYYFFVEIYQFPVTFVWKNYLDNSNSFF